MDKSQSLINLFPIIYRKKLRVLKQYIDTIEEVRIRCNMPICLYIEGKEYFIDENGNLTTDKKDVYQLSAAQVQEIFNHICDYSPYAFMDELKQGFLTVVGGHRIGVAGQVLLENEQVTGMKEVRFLNIRVSHEVLGAADGIIPYLIKDEQFMSTLIISSPGAGKTTLLRDIIRQLSDGNEFVGGMTVGVVDERSEIAGSYRGVPQNQIGLRTDVLDGCPKTKGMMMLIRSMAPKVVAIDELGGMEDINALKKVLYCGCKVLVTIHGQNLEEVRQKIEMKQLLNEPVFERFIILEQKNRKRKYLIMGKEGEVLCSV